MRISMLAVVSALFVFFNSAFGQYLSVGAIGGTSLTQDFRNQSVVIGQVATYSSPKRWIAGGMVEVRLPLNLSVEVDGLYHDLGFTSEFVEPNGTLNSVSPASVVTWEFPVLARYRFSLPFVKPFVEAGPSFRTAGNLNGTNPSHVGFASGIGVELHAWKIKISPQFRYLRWAHDGPTATGVNTLQNQAEFLASFSF